MAGFTLVGKLGAGGMAVVYEGHNELDPSIRRAIKVVRPELASQPEFLRRFAAEARTLEALSHPNIVRFFGVRKESGLLVMELELLQGRTFAKVLEASVGLPDPIEVAGWFAQACDGVGHAHRAAVVHRDLKPDNLFLTDDGVVKVLDFGIAKARDAADRQTRVTRAGMNVGTPEYMAPEVCKGETPNAGSDVYALGLSMLEMLIGHHPLIDPARETPEPMVIMFGHTEGKLGAVSDHRTDVPRWIDEVVRTATALDPSVRYTDAGELAQALRVGGGAQVPGRRATPPAGTAKGGATRLDLPTLADGKRAGRSVSGPTGVHLPTLDGADDVDLRGLAVQSRPLASRLAWLLVPVLLLGAGVLSAGLALGAWWLNRPAPEPPPEPEDPRVGLNPFVLVRVPKAPVSLGLGTAQGVGFAAGAKVVSPSSDFEIQQHEVTWQELEPWLAANPRHTFPRPDHVPADAPARARLPASGVPWLTADAYCHDLGEGAALPTEEQWEYAARGPELRPFSWGSQAIDPLRTNALRGSDWALAPVMSSPQDRTPGAAATMLYDLMGNAREWCVEPYRLPHTGKTPAAASRADSSIRVVRGLPLKPEVDGRVSSAPVVGAAWRMPLCGHGACLQEKTLTGESVTSALAEVGFRCVRPPASPEPGKAPGR